MTHRLHRTYDAWKLAGPDDEWQGDDDRPPDDRDRDPPEPSQAEYDRLHAIAICDKMLATCDRITRDLEKLKAAADDWRQQNADLLESGGQKS